MKQKEEFLCDLGQAQIFKQMTPKARLNKINKSQFVHIKTTFPKTPLRIVKRQATDTKKIFSNHAADKTLASRIHEEFWQSNEKHPPKSVNLFRNGVFTDVIELRRSRLSGY